MDPRATKLAAILVNHSVKAAHNDKVVISLSDFSGLDLVKECYRLCLEKGAEVYLDVFGTNFLIGRADFGGLYPLFLSQASLAQLQKPPQIMSDIIDWGNKFIRITTIHNRNFTGNVDHGKVSTWQKTFNPIFKKLIDKTWVLTYFPSLGVAQNANMSLEDFTDFYYQACIVDYQEMDRTIRPLQDILDKAKEVQIVGNNVDLKFNVEGRWAAGEGSGFKNVPDGECYIAPVEDKTEGFIKFELPQNKSGNEVSGIYLEFKAGRVVKFSAETNEAYLRKMFEDDPGNMRVGELGIGMNKNIKNYIKDILFDEKIYGTIHMAMGFSYTEKRGGGKNTGSMHWDMIKDLRHPGSKIVIDDQIIMKDGKVLI